MVSSRKDLKLLRNPSCDSQNLFRLGAAINFDRYANENSLPPPPAAARRRSPARACLGQVLSNKKRNSHQNGDCFFLAGAEGLGLACRLGRCFCTSCRGLHRRPAPLDTLRVPSVQIIQSEPKQKDTRRCLFVLAGAEGLEPSARGFGDRCSTN